MRGASACLASLLLILTACTTTHPNIVFTTPSPTPAAPTGFGLSVAPHTIQATWDQPSAGSGGLGWRAYAASVPWTSWSNALPGAMVGTSTSCCSIDLVGLADEQSYWVAVAAFDSAGDGPLSTELTARPPGWGHTIEFGTTSDDGIAAAIAEPSGTIFGFGVTKGSINGQSSAGKYDAFLSRIDAAGVFNWTDQFGTAGDETAYGLARAPGSKIVLTGSTTGALDGSNAGSDDIFVMEVDTADNLGWVRQFGTSASDTPSSIAVDSSGNIFVAGSTSGLLGSATAGGTDVFVARLSATGTRVWTTQQGTASTDGATAVVQTTFGVFAAGITNGALNGNASLGSEDDFLMKLDPTNGSVIWTKQFGTASTDSIGGLASDSAGNLYVVGTTLGTFAGNTSAGGYDAFLIKFDPSGNVVWVRQLGSSNYDQANGVCVDSQGNVAITGITLGEIAGNLNAGQTDIFVAKYDSTGAIQWVRMLGSSGQDYGSSITATEGDSLIVIGTTSADLDGGTFAGGTGVDPFIAKFDAAGAKE